MFSFVLQLLLFHCFALFVLTTFTGFCTEDNPIFDVQPQGLTRKSSPNWLRTWGEIENNFLVLSERELQIDSSSASDARQKGAVVQFCLIAMKISLTRIGGLHIWLLG